MTVSVVIPTFNNEPTLEATVRSILVQSHQDFEIVVVNDGGCSPSGFLTITDPRLRILESPRNGGVSAARNLGFQATSGEIVYFLDADDLAAPDLLAFASSVFDDETVTVLCVGHDSVLDADLRDGGMQAPPFAIDRHSSLERLSPEAFHILFRDLGNMFLPSFAFFRREVLVETAGPSPWDERLRHAEDTFLFLLVGTRNSVVVSQDRYVIYRVRPDSLSRNELASWSGRIDAMDALITRLRSEGAQPWSVASARRMRQSAARRVARLLHRQGSPTQARHMLRSDLRAAFNWKSAVELARQAMPGRR